MHEEMNDFMNISILNESVAWTVSEQAKLL